MTKPRLSALHGPVIFRFSYGLEPTGGRSPLALSQAPENHHFVGGKMPTVGHVDNSATG